MIANVLKNTFSQGNVFNHSQDKWMILKLFEMYPRITHVYSANEFYARSQYWTEKHYYYETVAPYNVGSHHMHTHRNTLTKIQTPLMMAIFFFHYHAVPLPNSTLCLHSNATLKVLLSVPLCNFYIDWTACAWPIYFKFLLQSRVKNQ